MSLNKYLSETIKLKKSVFVDSDGKNHVSYWIDSINSKITQKGYGNDNVVKDIHYYHSKNLKNANLVFEFLATLEEKECLFSNCGTYFADNYMFSHFVREGSEREECITNTFYDMDRNDTSRKFFVYKKTKVLEFCGYSMNLRISFFNEYSKKEESVYLSELIVKSGLSMKPLTFMKLKKAYPNEKEFMGILKFLGVNSKSEFKNSIKTQIWNWLNSNSQYEKPISPKQLYYIFS